MGFRFRKSINLGGGTKINFGKSSVGISSGFKGFRTSINSKGRKTTSVGIPGSGISYVKTSNISGGSKSNSGSNFSGGSGAAYPPTGNYSSKPPFYKATWFLVVCSIFIPPVGILLLWLFSSRSKRFKIGVTIPLALYSIVWLIAVFSDKSASSSAAVASTPSQIVSTISEPSSTSSEALSSVMDSSSFSSAPVSSAPTSSVLVSSAVKPSSAAPTSSKAPAVSSKSAVVAVVPKPSTTPAASSKSASSKASAAPTQTLKSTAVPGTVQNGENATLSIVGKPNTKYTISVFYSTRVSEAKGLEAKTSDGSGNVSWTWKVGANTNPGTHRIVISGGGEELERSITTVK